MSKAASFHRHIFASRSDEELERIAHTKRFLEVYTGDDAFRAELLRNARAPRELAARHGLAVDPRELLPLWHPDFAGRDPWALEERDWPLAGAWLRFVSDLRKHRALCREQGAMAEVSPRFHAWRERQRARCASEVPSSAEFITHGIAAFELSLGCSKACWFCGVSADRFAGYSAYNDESQGLWRDILHTLHGLFGEASHTGFCYWATDPSDNPDYARFIDDYRDITGYVPQTTTAAPLKNLALTRELMRLAREYPSHPVRFSVTSLRSLQEIHRAFTARELVDVELICQNREALGVMALAGRARDLKKAHDERRDAGRPVSAETAVFHRLREEHATIACVSGFLINLIKRTVALITPTQASDRWPLGYRVYDERTFRDGAAFRAQIEDMIARHMPESLAPARRVAFRADLARESRPGDPSHLLRLKGKWATHETQGPPFLGRLGEFIAQGDHTVESLRTRLAREGIPGEHVAGVLQHLFGQGFLDDEPAPAPGC